MELMSFRTYASKLTTGPWFAGGSNEKFFPTINRVVRGWKAKRRGCGGCEGRQQASDKGRATGYPKAQRSSLNFLMASSALDGASEFFSGLT